MIFDLDRLHQYIPNRKDAELKSVFRSNTFFPYLIFCFENRYLVEGYKRKSHLRSTERRQSEQQQPLERWHHICYQALKGHYKKNDSSQLLILLMQSFEEDYASKLDKKSQEYSHIYRFLRQLMQGMIPADLPVTSSFLLLAFLDNLCQLAEQHRTADDEKLVQQLFHAFSQQESNKTTTGEESEQDGDELQVSLAFFDRLSDERLEKHIKAAKFILKEAVESGDQSAGQLNSLEDPGVLLLVQDRKQNPLHHYSNLPKIQMIKECFNPLKVPVVELRRQHRHLIELLKSNLDDTTI